MTVISNSADTDSALSLLIYMMIFFIHFETNRPAVGIMYYLFYFSKHLMVAGHVENQFVIVANQDFYYPDIMYASVLETWFSVSRFSHFPCILNCLFKLGNLMFLCWSYPKIQIDFWPVEFSMNVYNYCVLVHLHMQFQFFLQYFHIHSIIQRCF